MTSKSRLERVRPCTHTVAFLPDRSPQSVNETRWNPPGPSERKLPARGGIGIMSDDPLFAELGDFVGIHVEEFA